MDSKQQTQSVKASKQQKAQQESSVGRNCAIFFGVWAKGKEMKKRKGERIRPCVRCEMPVKFINSGWSAYNKHRKGWHWVNEDGAHHRCSDFAEAVEDDFDLRWRAAMERDYGPYDAENER